MGFFLIDTREKNFHSDLKIGTLTVLWVIAFGVGFLCSRYMNFIPKTLGDIYYGLGTQIPSKLASVLPSDFFSDDSLTLDSKSPGLPPSLSSVLTPGAVCVGTESDQLEELRTRSAKKRR